MSDPPLLRNRSPTCRAASFARLPVRACEGADYVLVPRILAAQHLRHVVEVLLGDDAEAIARLKHAHLDQLQAREEVVS